MTLSQHKRLRPSPVAGHIEGTLTATSLEGTAEALAMFDFGASTDWTYSATAEGRTGEVAVRSVDMDGEPGLIYNGQPNAGVTVTITGLDVEAGTPGTPAAADEVTVGIFKNNDLIAVADEGFVSELDTATAEFNVSGYVDYLVPNDVIRVGLIVGIGSTDASDYQIVDGTNAINID